MQMQQPLVCYQRLPRSSASVATRWDSRLQTCTQRVRLDGILTCGRVLNYLGHIYPRDRRNHNKAHHEPSARGKSIEKAVHQGEDHFCKASKAACDMPASRTGRLVHCANDSSANTSVLSSNFICLTLKCCCEHKRAHPQLRLVARQQNLLACCPSLISRLWSRYKS